MRESARERERTRSTRAFGWVCGFFCFLFLRAVELESRGGKKNETMLPRCVLSLSVALSLTRSLALLLSCARALTLADMTCVQGLGSYNFRCKRVAGFDKTLCYFVDKTDSGDPKHCQGHQKPFQ